MTSAADTLMGIFGFKRVDIKMEDDKLIQLAAKAAGIVLANGRDVTDIHPSSVHYLIGPQWNPLTNDGDALRLAVKCSISVNTMLVDGMNRPRHETAACSSYGLPISHHKHNGDPCAATRRAIVRAAAAIGESMHD